MKVVRHRAPIVRSLSLCIVLATAVLSLHAAQRRQAWDGPDVKRSAAEKEAAKKVALVAVRTMPFSKNDAFLRKFPGPLLRIISGYVPEFNCFNPVRELRIPHLIPTKRSGTIEPGMCTCFIDKNKQAVYFVEDKNSGNFRLYNHDGTERAYCTVDTNALVTAGANALTKVFVMPPAKGDSDKEKERPYRFVTSSRNGAMRFWSEDGKELKTLGFGDLGGILDFDIVTDQNYNGQKRDILAVTINHNPSIFVYDISSMTNIQFLTRLHVWGNMGATHIRLLPSTHGLKAVTSENRFNIHDMSKEPALCWYDVESRHGFNRIVNFNGVITHMDSICDDEQAQVFVGDATGVIRGFGFVHATDTAPQILDKFEPKKGSDAIVSLRVYSDADDLSTPHVVVQADDGAVHDINIETQCIDKITTSSAKNKPLCMGLSSDRNGRPCLLVRTAECLQLWEKDQDPFNGCLVEGMQKSIECAEVLVPPVDEIAAPASCACIIQ